MSAKRFSTGRLRESTFSRDIHAQPSIPQYGREAADRFHSDGLYVCRAALFVARESARENFILVTNKGIFQKHIHIK